MPQLAGGGRCAKAIQNIHPDMARPRVRAIQVNGGIALADRIAAAYCLGQISRADLALD